MEYKIGQRVQNVSSKEGNLNKELYATVINVEPCGFDLKKVTVRYDHGGFGLSTVPHKDYLLITDIKNNKPIMKTISIMMQKLLDADTQTLVKAGYINGDLELTVEGTKALNAVLFTTNKDALVELAKAQIEAAKA